MTDHCSNSGSLAGGPPRSAAPRHELVHAIGAAMREAASQRARLTQALAERFSIVASDMESLEFAYLRGGATVNELAAAKGVTPGAISQTLNRLEAKELTFRQSDPRDRRKTIVRLSDKALCLIMPMYQEVVEATLIFLAQHTDQDLVTANEVIKGYAAALCTKERALASSEE